MARNKDMKSATAISPCAGPKYYARFRHLCVDVIQKYGINQFKFDGIGAIGSDDDQALFYATLKPCCG